MPSAPAPTLEPAADIAPAGEPLAPSEFKPNDVPESVRKLASLFADTDGPPEETPDKPAAEPKPDAKPKLDAAKPDAAKPAGEPAAPELRVRRDKIKRPDLPIAQPAAAPAAPAAEEPYKPDAQWEKSLVENEREMLDDAKDAERLFPDKYKGLVNRTAKFLRDHAAETAKEDFDDQSPKYREWLEKNQPKLSRPQIRELEETRVASRVKQEWEGKYNDLQHKLFVRDQEPRFEQERQALFAELRDSSLPDDLTKAVKEMGASAADVYGMEMETAQRVLAVATDDLTEFRRLTTKDPETGRTVSEELVEAPVGNPNDPGFQQRMEKFQQHERLRKLVDHLCASYTEKAYGQNADGKLAMRDGKYFVTREEWAKIIPAKRGQYWTFSNAELIGEAKKSVRVAVDGAISRRREEMKKYRWEAPKPPVAAAPKIDQPPPQPTGAPRTPGPAPLPAGGDGAPGGVDARIKALSQRLTSGE